MIDNNGIRTKCNKATILIVGPSRVKKTAGGVVRHMHSLSQLAVLSNRISMYDLGSTDGRLTTSVLGLARRCLRMSRIVRTYRYDQVWVNSSIYHFSFLKLMLILFSLRNLKGPIVRIFFHGGRFTEIGYLRCRPISLSMEMLLRRANSIHFLSREQGEGFALIFPTLKWDLFVNYLPYDTTLSATHNDIFTLLFVGRLIEEKGVYQIMAAFDELYHMGRGPQLALWFVGDGPALESLKKISRSYQGSDIRFFGHVEGEPLNELYSRASVFLLPSYREAFPYVILESMRAGLPIIATATGALPDIITEKENGFLITPKDSHALANSIVTLIDTIGLARSIGANNAAKFLRLFSTKSADDYYATLIDGSGRK